eukprot:s252_g19.t1
MAHQSPTGWSADRELPSAGVGVVPRFLTCGPGNMQEENSTSCGRCIAIRAEPWPVMIAANDRVARHHAEPSLRCQHPLPRPVLASWVNQAQPSAMAGVSRWVFAVNKRTFVCVLAAK